MIFVTAKFLIRPEYADQWPALTKELTERTRAEPGCLWFDWSRSVDNPNEYVIVEAFKDDDAGAAHVNSEHFINARRTLPQYLAETPRIVNVKVDQDEWSSLGEFTVE